LPQFVGHTCGSTSAIGVQPAGTGLDACTALCLDGTIANCKFVVFNTNDGSCKFCSDANNMEEQSLTKVYAVYQSYESCIGEDANKCLLFSTCNNAHNGTSQEFTQFALTGLGFSGETVDSCRDSCYDNLDCTNYAFWPDDGACELCSSGGSVLDTQTTPTVFFQKNINSRFPLHGMVQNVRLWDRKLDASEIALSHRQDLCDDSGCYTTMGDLPAHRLEMCGAWDSSNYSWPVNGGKLFFRCSNCSYPEPDTEAPNVTALIPSGELLEVGEGMDGETYITGTGGVVNSAGVLSRTRLPNLVSTGALHGIDRPVAIPASNKPFHEEYQVPCSVVRLEKAKAVVCAPAIEAPILYNRCIADYCLTGSEVLAQVDVAELDKENAQRAMMEEEEELLGEEEQRELQEIGADGALAAADASKQSEQDAAIGQVLHVVGTSGTEPTPP